MFAPPRPRRVLFASLALLLGLTLYSSRARADDFHYRPEWRKFGAVDYVATGATVAALVTLEFSQGEPTYATWTSPVPLMDVPVRDAIVADSRDARERATLYSDWLWHGLAIFPFVDVTLTPLNRGADGAAIWQLSMINVQAFATAGLLVRIPQKWLGRTRPTVIGCDEDPDYSSQCKSTIRFASFPGGHFAAATTGAGLTCAHHLHGRLYGGSGDIIACGSTLGAAGLVGYLRLYADEHWLSDQLVAGAMGLFSGYVMPTLLYYRPFWRSAPKPAKAAQVQAGTLSWTLAPQITPDTLGISLLLLEAR
ncbi:MAG TPA: phosphatase PAP2 family protein [Polyangiaceae bacterium]|nr:phosphatase PAP2 family protein [Polyangiaceae bacterium]